MTKITVAVDWENNSETFWREFWRRFPQFFNKDVFEVTPEEWEEIKSLPGWDDASAPTYAPYPLVVIED